MAAMALSQAPVHALTAEQALAMADGDNNSRIAAMQDAVATGDATRVADFLNALRDGQVQYGAGRAFIVRGGEALDAVTGQATALPEGVDDASTNNRIRREIGNAQAALNLFVGDDSERLSAAKAMLEGATPQRLPMLDKALAKESNEAVKAELEMARSAALLGSSNAAERMAAAALLAQRATPATRLLLSEQLTREQDEKVQIALKRALAEVNDKLAWGERLGVAFTGISLGSILLLVALGLAITYGLMGVINMAHGELMMIGAYATYVVQGVFRSYLPEFFDWYLLAAVPVSFMAAALAGAAQPHAAAEPFDSDCFCLRRAGWSGLHHCQNTPGPVCARCHAKPPDCRVHGGQYSAGRHHGLCTGQWHCRFGGLRLEPGGQRGA